MDLLPTWVANQPLGIWMTTFKMQNLVHVGSIFPNFCSNLRQYWLKLKKILEKSGGFAQNLATKMDQLVYMK